jgi:hypothetical protein
MKMTNKVTWKFQTVDGLSVVDGYATDARGLRLRAECGYSHVNMGNGWLQMSVAIRKVDLAERMALLDVQS